MRQKGLLDTVGGIEEYEEFEETFNIEISNEVYTFFYFLPSRFKFNVICIGDRVGRGLISRNTSSYLVLFWIEIVIFFIIMWQFSYKFTFMLCITYATKRYWRSFTNF